MAGVGRARRGEGRPRPKMPSQMPSSRSLELLVAAMVEHQLALQQLSVQHTATEMHGGPTAHLLSSPPHLRRILDTAHHPGRPLLSSTSSGASPEPPTPSSGSTAHLNSLNYPHRPPSPKENVQEAMSQLLLSPPSAALMPPPPPSARIRSLPHVRRYPSHDQSTHSVGKGTLSPCYMHDAWSRAKRPASTA